jgi:hypothetical protein
MNDAFSEREPNRPSEQSITERSPPSELEDGHAAQQEFRLRALREQTLWTGTLLQLTIHAFFGGGIVLILLLIVPKFKKIFEDFAMKLPWATELLIDISDWIVEFFPLFTLVMAVLLVGDGVVLHLLRRQENTRGLSKVWFILILLLLLLIVAVLVAACFLPLYELSIGLSK